MDDEDQVKFESNEDYVLEQGEHYLKAWTWDEGLVLLIRDDGADGDYRTSAVQISKEDALMLAQHIEQGYL